MKLFAVVAVLMAGGSGFGQGSAHQRGVDRRGDQAMGFSHEKTRHHFLLYRDGGAIRIVPKDPKDTGSVAGIRDHLKMIAPMFQAGNFNLPMFIHATEVPGTKVMKQRRRLIRYRYHEVPHGAEVLISTHDRKAVEAIHQFLRFQIRDHRTGDSGKVGT